MVNMLLEREDVNPNQAAMIGHEGVVKMLLDRVDVNAGSVRKRLVRLGLGSRVAGLRASVRLSGPIRPDCSYYICWLSSDKM